MDTPHSNYPIRNAVIRIPVKATNMQALVCNILWVPPVKTVSNGLPPPDDPRFDCPPWLSAVCVGLGTLVDGTVVVPLASVGVVLTAVVSVSVGIPGIVVVVELSLLSDVEVVIVDVVIVDELSVVLVVDFDVSCVWLGVKKVCVVVGFTVEVTGVA
jgi:hypothetical protein